MAKKNVIKYDGELDLAGLIISCYVLEDGTRILSGRGMQNALKIVDDTETGKQSAGTRFARYLSQKSLQPFIYGDKEQDHFKPIICYNGEQKIHGYEATILVDICDAFLEARKHIKLSSRQEIIAKQCEILMRSFARVGITALVDEATGYQYDRENDELQKILKAYISEELLPWQKTFPDVFYKELFRLNGWDFTVNGIKKRPGVIGTWTKKLIYERLPEGVLEELEESTPKSKSGNKTARLHQSLTTDIGNPSLMALIYTTVGLLQGADNMQNIWYQVEKIKNRESGQLELPFEFDEKGHTIEPIENNVLLEHNKKEKRIKQEKLF